LNITPAAPSQIRHRKLSNRPRYDWTPLLSALTSQPGVWLSVPLSDLPDTPMKKNQAAINVIARRHVGLVQTQTEGDIMFVRLVVPKTN
jgi:hypothetical protein